MNTRVKLACGALVIALGSLAPYCLHRQAAKAEIERLVAAAHGADIPHTVKIQYPFDEALFPSEIAAPEFRWNDSSGADQWLVLFEFPSGHARQCLFAATNAWAPPERQWAGTKRWGAGTNVHVTVLGRQTARPGTVLSRGEITIGIANEAVGAPIFYREVNLPFIEAVKDSTRIRWRFGSVAATKPPPVVLTGMPVCGNCHSFPRDGSVLAMDVDYANNKGSYVIAPLGSETSLTPKDVITWDSYRRVDGEQTFGLLSQISPDGRFVVSTVKDRSVFVPKPDLAFSQLFFPIKGILVVFDRQTRQFRSLPGADDPRFVQSNPVWSPDGKWIVFARAKAYQLRKGLAPGQVLLSAEDCAEFVHEGQPFQFDLYRVPFNGGGGGVAEPLAGASRNGFSNFFPKYSPDGRWIVFCQARNYMLLQPDSELYIIPAQGGTARRLRANTARMNSWHSWSPNSHWLVFSSKANSPYTQLWLTHLDDAGNSTPPVVLDRLTEPDRAANIPEFVALPPNAIRHIEARFLNDYSYARSGFVRERGKDFDGAIQDYRRALELNPLNVHAHERLGYVLYNVKRDFINGLKHSQEAVRLAPENGQAQFLLGMEWLHQNRVNEGIAHLTASLPGMEMSTVPEYTPVLVHQQLGLALLLRGNYAEAAVQLAEAAKLAPNHPEIRFSLANALAYEGLIEEPLAQYRQAIALRHELEDLPQLHALLSLNCAKAGRMEEARALAEKALAVARKAGREDLARRVLEQSEPYHLFAPRR